MPTDYPVTLPPVPDEPETAWRAQRVGDTVFERPDEGWPSATTTFAIDASSAAEAELRVLAWIHHSDEDDLRQATATAEGPAGPDRWHVSLRILGEF
ncbi:hypothetical protein SGFS_000110 [Streptomyces graminofaciens]|uniref:Uncharacterized protein n=1 Tax=Streptomyces graminofaciens TaxID=68212 RepID=A0ABM7EZB1_9ACTN|nr:hypothetical protein [Streptomyces graminofaciens]BBC28720.1 hypothetical protein SGFS_000110 [Streptomyces graminofaciens]